MPSFSFRSYLKKVYIFHLLCFIRARVNAFSSRNCNSLIVIPEVTNIYITVTN